MSKHLVFYVHGMGRGESASEYPKLHGQLIKILAERGSKIQLELMPVQWDSQVAPGQKALYEKAVLPFLRRRDSLSFIGRMLQRTPLVDTIRHLLLDYVGDVVAYTSIRDNGIEKGFLTPLKEAMQKDSPPTFSLVCHSLGAVIAFDFVFNLFTRGSLFVSDEATCLENAVLINTLKDRFRGLYTFGSPTALFLMRQSDLWKDGRNFNNLTNPITASKGRWVNFYDAEDLIAIPLSTLFPNTPDNRFSEIQIQTGDDLAGNSHTGYWENMDMAQRIATEIESAELTP